MSGRHNFVVVPVVLGVLAIGFAIAQDGPGPEPPITQPGGAVGAVQYNSSGLFAGTGPGSSGEVLTSNGAGMAPTFQAATGGGRSGTYSAAVDGCATAPAWTVAWYKSGDIATLRITAGTTGCTSDETTFSLNPANAPADIIPSATVRGIPVVTKLLDDGVRQLDVSAVVANDGTIFFSLAGSLSGWTASGTKGFGTGSGENGIVFTYPVVP
jgi:hypothetical protein